MKQNLILDKSFDYALEIIELYKILAFEHKEYVLSKQLLRSGTSIGANIEEAVGAQSKKDFISKMSIALKESRETRYWLRLLQRSQLVKKDYTETIKESENIINIISKIVITSKNNT